MNLDAMLAHAIAQIEGRPPNAELPQSTDFLLALETMLEVNRSAVVAAIHQINDNKKFYLVGYLDLDYDEFADDDSPKPTYIKNSDSR